ncbi:MAG: phage N-6-adenine-methyltransferase [Magnetococcus sp. YQC-5]
MPYEGAKDGKHYWLTPPDLMAELDAEHHFDFDPCPYPQPEGFDGLTVEWGQSNYVNPPFKGPTKWVRKAIEEFKKGKKVVLVFPIDKWIHYLIEQGVEIRNLKDVRWHAIEDGTKGKGTGRWIAEFILDPSKNREIAQ